MSARHSKRKASLQARLKAQRWPHLRHPCGMGTRSPTSLVCRTSRTIPPHNARGVCARHGVARLEGSLLQPDGMRGVCKRPREKEVALHTRHPGANNDGKTWQQFWDQVNTHIRQRRRAAGHRGDLPEACVTHQRRGAYRAVVLWPSVSATEWLSPPAGTSVRGGPQCYRKTSCFDVCSHAAIEPRWSSIP